MQIFAKQAKIQVSEIFAVLIFVVGESGTHGLASSIAKAEQMSRIVYRERWQCQLFQCGEKSSLVSRTFVETIASTPGLAPPSVCAYVALRFPGWLGR